MDDEDAPTGDGGASDGDDSLPPAVIEEAERLTRLAREAVDENERAAYRARRARLLDAHGYAARVREEDSTLVCHPAEWLEDGTVRIDRIEDTSRAVEVPLEGAGDPDDWGALDGRNRELADAVRAEHGEVHGANADAFADFMGNHYARPVTSASREEIEEFLTDYFVRNAWPTEAQREVVERSIELVFETAGEPAPEIPSVDGRSG